MGLKFLDREIEKYNLSTKYIYGYIKKYMKLGREAIY
jgi:hypothetical protein